MAALRLTSVRPAPSLPSQVTVGHVQRELNDLRCRYLVAQRRRHFGEGVPAQEAFTGPTVQTDRERGSQRQSHAGVQSRDAPDARSEKQAALEAARQGLDTALASEGDVAALRSAIAQAEAAGYWTYSLRAAKRSLEARIALQQVIAGACDFDAMVESVRAARQASLPRGEILAAEHGLRIAAAAALAAIAERATETGEAAGLLQFIATARSADVARTIIDEATRQLALVRQAALPRLLAAGFAADGRVTKALRCQDLAPEAVLQESPMAALKAVVRRATDDCDTTVLQQFIAAARSAGLGDAILKEATQQLQAFRYRMPRCPGDAAQEERDAICSVCSIEDQEPFGLRCCGRATGTSRICSQCLFQVLRLPGKRCPFCRAQLSAFE